MTIDDSPRPSNDRHPPGRRPRRCHLLAAAAAAAASSLILPSGCQTKKQEPIVARAAFRAWIVPRQFDTARRYQFVPVTPPDPNLLTAERVAGKDLDYLVLTYEKDAGAPPAREPFTALLQWEPKGVLEIGVIILNVFGDGSGAEMFLEGEDIEGAGFVYDLGPISWEGWREIKLSLEKPSSFYGVKQQNPVVRMPMQLTALGLRDVQNRGAFRIVLAKVYIEFPWRRPASEQPAARTEPEQPKRTSRFGVPTSPDTPFNVQHPVETKVRRPVP